METIVFKIGAAIAKGILKLWLKDAGIAKDVSLSLVDGSIPGCPTSGRSGSLKPIE